MISGTYDFTEAVIAEDIECASRQAPPSAGRGGKQPSKAETRQSTKTSPTQGSSRSAASPTGSGRKVRSSLPASGGFQAKSTQRPGNSCPTKSAAPKSTGGLPILGEHGHG